MKHQKYSNHRQFVPFLHYFLMPLGFLTFISSLAYFIYSLVHSVNLLIPAFILIFGMYTLLSLPVARSFALKAQDRAIRAEENLRHYVLTGKALHPQLTIQQIIALRFAGDKEFPILSQKAIEQNMKPDQIKKEIRDWRSDFHRV